MPLEHAILAFLGYGPMTGYDLKKFFDNSVAHFWTATQSHIYKALGELEAKGWAQKELVQQDDLPNRKEYHITEAGRAELRTWLSTPLRPEPVRSAWLIQIFFAHGLQNEEIARVLEARRDMMREHIHTYQTSGQSYLNENAHDVPERIRTLWQITLDYGIRSYQDEIVWLDETIARVLSLPPIEQPKS